MAVAPVLLIFPYELSLSITITQTHYPSCHSGVSHVCSCRQYPNTATFPSKFLEASFPFCVAMSFLSSSTDGKAAALLLHLWHSHQLFSDSLLPWLLQRSNKLIFLLPVIFYAKSFHCNQCKLFLYLKSLSQVTCSFSHPFMFHSPSRFPIFCLRNVVCFCPCLHCSLAKGAWCVLLFGIFPPQLSSLGGNCQKAV